MTPKTQYQKMRDNRARRESMLANADEFEPLSDTHINGVRFKHGSLWDPARPMVATLEDGSTLTASEPYWYPDNSGEWVEIISKGSELYPLPLAANTKVQTLSRHERARRCWDGRSISAAENWHWPSMVAYRVAE